MPYLDTLMQRTKSSTQGAPEAPPKDDEEAEEKKILVEQYADVKIYRVPGEPLYLYEIPSPHYKGEEKELINALMDIAIGVMTNDAIVLQPEERRKKYFERVMDIIDQTPELKVPVNAKEFYANAVVRDMVGYGIIDPMTQDEWLEEIMIIGPNRPVYVYHRKYDIMKTNVMFYDDKDIRDLVDRIARGIGRRIDTQVPILDARLKDGTRVNATIPPISLDGSTLTLRKFRKDPMSMIDLINYGTFNFEAAAFMWLATDGMGVRPANTLVSGGTASGKTTTLNILSSFIPNIERIISIEDTAELSLPLKHWIRFEVRPPSLEGTGEIDMNELVKTSLRMRPDRILVGEIRGAEGYTMFAAMNTGHSGAATAAQTVQMASGEFKTIGELFDSAKGEAKTEDGFEYVEMEGENVLCFDKRALALDAGRVTRVWRRKTALDETILELKTSSGRAAELTRDHPVYRLNSDGLMEQIGAGELREGDWLLVPRKTSTCGGSSLSEDAAYCLGILLGDGNLNRDGLNASLDAPELAHAFEAALLNAFGAKAKTKYYDYRSSFQTTCYDVKLKKRLVELGVPEGDKTKTFTVPDAVAGAGDKEVAAFLRGLFDCEACVNEHAKGIFFTLANEEACSQVKTLLLRFGIQSRIYRAEKDGRGKNGPYWTVAVYGAENLRLFAEKIGFVHEKKAHALQMLAKAEPNTNVDVVPAGRAIAAARKKIGLTQEELACRALGVKTRSDVRAYESGVRHPSKTAFKKIAEALKNEFNKQVGESASFEEDVQLLDAKTLLLHLQSLARDEAGFERVASLREKPAGDYVYDLTVESNHTFLAGSNGGLFVSNCMGTVHANSAKETLVRLANPPINVPSIMLTSLNFILMQNRIHDRRKGMIRRITELAEVVPTDEGQIELQNLYEWDPVKDALVRTSANSAYLQLLQKYTGLDKKALQQELDEREAVLRQLVKSGTNKLDAVCEVTQNYIIKKRTHL
ncbi:Replication factor C small subunit [Candidatus Norongarragalina meridionalis]|nr:Replication factor C small subunit [Candidatus Norongarragalina meridionalis]